MSVWRLEFPQPDGWRIDWLGPYTSHWLTAEAEEVVRHMEAEHCVTHPHPRDPGIFASYPGDDRLSCGCASRELLERWFGDYLPLLLDQGAHVAHYSVPADAIVEESPEQVLFITRRATVVERSGHEAPAPLIRSSAGSRRSIIAASGGKYDFRGVPHRSWVTDAIESYDRVADRYADLVRSGLEDLPREAALVDQFARRIVERGGGPVLDVGCGPGHLTRLLASKGLRPAGVDASTGMLRRAREDDPDLPVAAATLTRLPFADGAAAGVLCWYVLHHVPDDDLSVAVGELARVTAPGGQLMLGGHVGESAYVRTEGYGGLPMRVLFARRSPDSYAALLRDAGLVVDATVALGPGDPAPGAAWLAHKPH